MVNIVAAGIAGLLTGASLMWVFMTERVRALRAIIDRAEEMNVTLDGQRHEQSERAEKERQRADLLADRLLQVVAGVRPVSEPGKQEQREVDQREILRGKEWNELFGEEADGLPHEPETAPPAG